MGNCCSPQQEQGNVQIADPLKFKADLHNKIFDDREIAGLQGQEKEQLIVKIQAQMRGNLDRKKVEHQFGYRFKGAVGGDLGQEPNYDNQTVRDIRAHLGDYKYEPLPSDDGIRRE